MEVVYLLTHVLAAVLVAAHGRRKKKGWTEAATQTDWLVRSVVGEECENTIHRIIITAGNISSCSIYRV